jgi:hypothetical protein
MSRILLSLSLAGAIAAYPVAIERLAWRTGCSDSDRSVDIPTTRGHCGE